jgi:hypothetical protein
MIIAEAAALDRLFEAKDADDETESPEEAQRLRVARLAAERPGIAAAARASTVMPQTVSDMRPSSRGMRLTGGLSKEVKGVALFVGGQTYAHLVTADDLKQQARDQLADATAEIERHLSESEAALDPYRGAKSVSRSALCNAILTPAVKKELESTWKIDPELLKSREATSGTVERSAVDMLMRQIKQASEAVGTQSSLPREMSAAAIRAAEIIASLEEDAESMMVLDTLQKMIKGGTQALTVEKLLALRILTYAKLIKQAVISRQSARDNLDQLSGGKRGIERVSIGGQEVITLPPEAVPEIANAGKRDPASLSEHEHEVFRQMGEAGREHTQAKGRLLVAQAGIILDMREEVVSHYEQKLKALEDLAAEVIKKDADKSTVPLTKGQEADAATKKISRDKKAMSEARKIRINLQRITAAFDQLQSALSSHPYAKFATQSEDEGEPLGDSEDTAVVVMEDADLEVLERFMEEQQARVRKGSKVKLTDAEASGIEELASEAVKPRGVVTIRQLNSLWAAASKLASLFDSDEFDSEEFDKKYTKFADRVNSAISANPSESKFTVSAAAAGATRIRRGSSGSSDVSAVGKEAEAAEQPILAVDNIADNDKLEAAINVMTSESRTEDEAEQLDSLIKTAGDIGGVVPVGAIPGDPRGAVVNTAVRDASKFPGIGKLIAAASIDDKKTLRKLVDSQTSALVEKAESTNRTRKLVTASVHKIKDELDGITSRRNSVDAARIAVRASLKSMQKTTLDASIKQRIRTAREDTPDGSAKRIFLTPDNVVRGAHQLALDTLASRGDTLSSGDFDAPYGFPFGSATGDLKINAPKGKTQEEHRAVLAEVLKMSDLYGRALGGAASVGNRVVVPAMIKGGTHRLSLGICIVSDLVHEVHKLVQPELERLSVEDPVAKHLLDNNKSGIVVNVMGVTLRCAAGCWRVGSTAWTSGMASEVTESLLKSLRKALTESGLGESFINNAVGLDEATGTLILRGVAPAFVDGSLSNWNERLSAQNWPTDLSRSSPVLVSNDSAITLRSKVAEGGREYLPAHGVQMDPVDLGNPISPFNIIRDEGESIAWKNGNDTVFERISRLKEITADEEVFKSRVTQHVTNLKAALKPIPTADVFLLEKPMFRFKEEKPVGVINKGRYGLRVVVPNARLAEAHQLISAYKRLDDDYESVSEMAVANQMVEIVYDLRPEIASPNGRITSFVGGGEKIAVGDLVYLAPMYEIQKAVNNVTTDDKFPPEIYGVGRVTRLLKVNVSKLFGYQTLLADVEFRGDQVKRNGKRGSIFSPTVTLERVGAMFMKKLPIERNTRLERLDPTRATSKSDINSNYGPGGIRALSQTALAGTGWDMPSKNDISLASSVKKSGSLAVGSMCAIITTNASQGAQGMLSGFQARSEIPKDVAYGINLEAVNAIIDVSGGGLMDEVHKQIKSLREQITGHAASATEIRQLFRSIDRDVAIRHSDGDSDLVPLPVPRTIESSLSTIYGCNNILRAILAHGPEKDTATHITREAERRADNPDEVVYIDLDSDKMLGRLYKHGDHTLEAKYAASEMGIRPMSQVGTTFRLQDRDDKGLAYTRLLIDSMREVQQQVKKTSTEIDKMIAASSGIDSKTLDEAEVISKALRVGLLGEIEAGVRSVAGLGYRAENADTYQNSLAAWAETQKERESLQTVTDVAIGSPGSRWNRGLMELRQAVMQTHAELLSTAPIPTSQKVTITSEGVIRVELGAPGAVGDSKSRAAWASTQSQILTTIGKIVQKSAVGVNEKDGKIFPSMKGLVEKTGVEAVTTLIANMKARYASHSANHDVLPWEADALAHPPLGDVINPVELREAIRAESSQPDVAPGLRSGQRLLLAVDHPRLGELQIVLSVALTKAIDGYTGKAIDDYTVNISKFIKSEPLRPGLEGTAEKSALEATIGDVIAHLKSGVMVGEQSAVLDKIVKRVEAYQKKFQNDVRREVHQVVGKSSHNKDMAVTDPAHAGLEVGQFVVASSMIVPDAAARASADLMHALRSSFSNVDSIAMNGSVKVRSTKPGNEEAFSAATRKASKVITMNERGQLTSLKSFPSIDAVVSLVETLAGLEKDAVVKRLSRVCVPIPSVDGIDTTQLLSLRMGNAVPPDLMPAVGTVLSPIG